MLLLLVLVALSSVVKADEWQIDHDTSFVRFLINARGTPIHGEISEWTAEIRSDGPDFSMVQISATFDVTSIATTFPLADPILQSALWLDTQGFPEATYISTSFKIERARTLGMLAGQLTLRGQTVRFAARVNWMIENGRLIADIDGTLDRLLFGIGTEASLEMADRMVRISAQITADRH
ncbi:MAG: YceI family protein [Pseudomonadota bacterium]